MKELKPCPFCGGKAARAVTDLYFWAIRCGKCGAENGNHDTQQEAIEAWNIRAERTCRAESHDCGDGVTGLYCSECGNYIDENDKYCPSCGARVVE